MKWVGRVSVVAVAAIVLVGIGLAESSSHHDASAPGSNAAQTSSTSTGTSGESEAEREVKAGDGTGYSGTNPNGPFTVSGLLTVPMIKLWTQQEYNAECAKYGIPANTQVLVKSNVGVLVAVGSVETSPLLLPGNNTDCDSSWLVSGIPRGRGPYEIDINGDTWYFTETGASSQQMNLTVSTP